MSGHVIATVEVELPPEAKNDPVRWMQQNVRGVYAVRAVEKVERCKCEQCSRHDAAAPWVK